MREHEEQFAEFGVQIVVVTFAADYFARQYARENRMSWSLLVDGDRELYHGYGMLKASFPDIWGPRTWWAYFREILRGNMPARSSGDIAQRGGDVLVDPAGIVRLHYIGEGPADRPDVRSILEVIRKSVSR